MWQMDSEGQTAVLAAGEKAQAGEVHVQTATEQQQLSSAVCAARVPVALVEFE